ncbi:MAG: class I SAM-dependent methyltransferase [Candidatus Omnitrophota bacterium]
MKESDIRPAKIFDEYLKLSEKDIKSFFKDCKYQNVKCPSCGSDGKFNFTKKGFNYFQCKLCMTLFANPRPVQKAFDRYYEGGLASRYWAEHFYKKTENARKKSIYKPRAKKVKSFINKYLPKAHCLIDIGAGYGTFCEELIKVMPRNFKVVAVEPSDFLSKICKNRELHVIKKFIEKVTAEDLSGLRKGRAVFTSFELLEHLNDPEKVLKKCAKMMHSGDLFIFTTLSGQGFDIRVLWEKSRSINPPHHLNFFNPISIRILMERCGFEVLEVTTPGKLDVSILDSNIKLIKDKFIKNLLKQASDNTKNELQGFLQKHNMSSHMMVVAKRK